MQPRPAPCHRHATASGTVGDCQPCGPSLPHISHLKTHAEVYHSRVPPLMSHRLVAPPEQLRLPAADAAGQAGRSRRVHGGCEDAPTGCWSQQLACCRRLITSSTQCCRVLGVAPRRWRRNAAACEQHSSPSHGVASLAEAWPCLPGRQRQQVVTRAVPAACLLLNIVFFFSSRVGFEPA